MLTDEEILALKKPKINYNLSEKDHAVIEECCNFFVKNIEIWFQVEDITKKIIFAGTKQIGIEVVFSQIRCNPLIQTTSNKFKLSNSYKPFYSRAFVHKNPKFDFIYNFRKSIADCVDYDLLFNYLAEKNNNKKESYV